MRRFAAVVLAVALAPGAMPAGAAQRPIAIVINGDALPLDPPPRLEKSVLLVPVRRTIEALGLDFERSGKIVTTQIGSETVSLTIGSRIASIDGRQVLLDLPSVEIHDVLYAPLRFFTDVLGAQARFDRRKRVVTILAQRVGRAADGLIATQNGYERFGTVSAIDVLSTPPTLTLEENGVARTIPIAANAVVDMQDVNVNVTIPGELNDVRPGDFARLAMRKDGRVISVTDAFGSRVGTIVAVAGNQFVLSDGQVVTAGRTMNVVLNGKPASFGDLLPGDRVSVRYNVETNEVREVLAGRKLAAVAPVPGSVQIDSVEADVTHPLRPGDDVRVTLHGTPGGGATFDIGSFVTDLAMHETASGSYEGTYRIPPDANFSEAPIIGRLRTSAGVAADVQAPQTVSASGTPPGIAAIAPQNGAVVNGRRPAIFASFVADAVAVNPSSATLKIDGHDVTADCVRSPQFIEYLPSDAYPNGPVHVTVSVADRAGNTVTKAWTFRVQAR